MTDPGEARETVLRSLIQAGAFHIDSHFVLASGQHATDFANARLIGCDPQALMEACYPIAEYYADKGIEVVIGPAEGGLSVAFCVTYLMNRIKKGDDPTIRNAYASKITDAGGNEGFLLKRGMDGEVAGKTCLLVDDVGTTGKSLRQTQGAIQRAGGTPAYGAYLIIRGEELTAESLGLRELYTPARLILPSWTPEECARNGPCSRKVPIRTDLGHGEAYVRRHGQPK